jgi:ADP-heptose:LPS heptosyltransferase
VKILAIQFRYFGDAVLLVPALRALAEHFQGCAVHALVSEEVVPLLEHLPWLARVWGMPRTRGRARLRHSWPIIRSLRREGFDRSIDFGGNDRGAILSLLCGARQRLAPRSERGFLGRRFCYTQMIPAAPLDRHEVQRNLHILTAWSVPPPRSCELELHPDPALSAVAEKALPERGILCHLGTGQPKKEWPLTHWAELFQRATGQGYRLTFSTGPGPREQGLMQELRKLSPGAPVLPPLPSLAAFLAVIQRAQLFIAGDTGPLHFAAGLGVPTISLFGATSATLWAPLGPKHQLLQGSACQCGGDTAVCLAARHCMAAISPADVMDRVVQALARPWPGPERVVQG